MVAEIFVIPTKQGKCAVCIFNKIKIKLKYKKENEKYQHTQLGANGQGGWLLPTATQQKRQQQQL